MYSIREVRKQDYNSICGFVEDQKECNYVFPRAVFPLTSEGLDSFVSSRKNSSVICESEAIIGFANIFDIKENIECSIGNFIIKKEFRQEGTGNYLLEEMIQVAVGTYGAKRIIIPCWCENSKAIMFYSKNGFKPYDIIIKNFNNINTPVLLFEKIIKRI